MHYLHFALLTVVCWGTYGVCMHIGSSSMGDKENGRIYGFSLGRLGLFPYCSNCTTYYIEIKGGNIAFWDLSHEGLAMVLIAGTLGAIGALGVLLAFGKMSSPAFVPVIMSIIFAGAPMVNALVSTTKEGNWAYVRWPFVLGIALAAVGGYMITKHAPKPPKTEAVSRGIQFLTLDF